MSREATKLVLGRGEVYFDRFLPGTRRGEGERYLGNTTSFRIQREIERLKRATSYRGRRITTAGSVIAESHSLNFTTDNIDPENIVMWFGGSVPQNSGAPHVDFTETLLVNRNRSYQLGKSKAPLGVRNVAYPVVSRGGVLVPSKDNWWVDGATGMLHIMRGAPAIPDGSQISVLMQVRESDEVSFMAEPKSLVGALRFVSKNVSPSGLSVQTHFYFPYIEIKPRGQTDMKSDEWQQWNFEAEAMNLSPAHPQLHVMQQTRVNVASPDERAINEEFGSLRPFPMWEDELHVVTNEEWPLALVIPPIP